MATMDSLIYDILHRIEDMRRTEDVLELNKLEDELQSLRQSIEAARKSLSRTRRLLDKTKKTLRIMSSILRSFDERKAKAENTWVSYWGIVRQCDAVFFEMEAIVSPSPKMARTVSDSSNIPASAF